VKLKKSPPTQDALLLAHEEIGAQAKALPYLAILSSAHALAILDRPFIEFPGLQAIQRVRHSIAGDALVTYWSSEGHFEMNRAALSDRLGAAVAFSGGLGALEAPTKPLWKRYTPLQILLTLSGIAGAMQVLASNYEKIAAPPELSITLEKADVQHAIAGEPFIAKATLENFLSSVNHRRVMVEAMLRPASGPVIPLTVPDSPLAGLGAGKSHTVTITGTVPARGTYKLEVVASAKAGLLSKRASFRANTLLRAWADEPEPSPLHVSSRRAIPIILAQVEVGRDAPAGVVCSTTFKATKGASLVMDWFLARPHTPDYGVYGSEVVVVKWTWPKLSGRSAPIAEWSFKGHSLDEMKELAKTAQTRCIAKEGNA